MPFFDDNGGGTPIDVGTVILTKQNPKIHFKSGYYKEFTATTDPSLSLSKNIEYRHHVHSTTSTTQYVVNGSPTKTTDGLPDNYQASEAGGCFGKTWIPPVTGKIYTEGHTYGDGTWYQSYYCDKCHAHVAQEGSSGGWGNAKRGDTHICKAGYYVTSLICGHTRGEVVSAKITF
jgi:hypothetical protein